VIVYIEKKGWTPIRCYGRGWGRGLERLSGDAGTSPSAGGQNPRNGSRGLNKARQIGLTEEAKKREGVSEFVTTWKAGSPKGRRKGKITPTSRGSQNEANQKSDQLSAWGREIRRLHLGRDKPTKHYDQL